MAATIHIHHRHLLLLLSPKADTHFTGRYDSGTYSRVQFLRAVGHNVGSTTINWLVGWLEFNAPFQHKYGYIRDEQQ